MVESNAERLSPEALRQWHTELLQSTVNRVYSRVPFYRKAMDRAGVTPSDIHSVDDITKLPFTTRKDLAHSYPYDFFAVPLRDIIRIHTLRSCWETPVVVGYTRSDIEHQQERTSHFLCMCGVEPEDIVQICLDDPGMSVWGQELKEGAETLGALVIPPDPLSTRSRLKILVDFKASVLVTTPSYGLHLLAAFIQASLPIASLSLRTGIFVGEPLTEETRERLETGFGITAYSAYGIIEAVGPLMAAECRCKSGLHIAVDHVIPEIVSPETGERLRPGETGELVVTTVRTKAIPLLRFRTGELTRLILEPCACGRTNWRMDPVHARCDRLVSIRGVKIDPMRLDAFMADRCNGTRLPSVLAVREEMFLKKIELWIAVRDEVFSGELPAMHTWLRSIEASFLEEFGIPCRALPVEAGRIAPYIEKGERIVFIP